MNAVRERVLGLRPGELHELVARHERQHAETMLQTLNLARLDGYEPPGRVAPPSGPPASGLELLDVAGATFPLGAAPEGFAYDNERAQRALEIAPFRIGRVPVTNGDWLSFVEMGGYRRQEWWSGAGWAWRSAEAIERPLNWTPDGREWRLGEGATTLDPSRPVIHVSAHEADAFARCHGLRLPTEAEWELAASWDGSVKLDWPWGSAPPDSQRANLIETRWFATGPAAVLDAGAAPCGALGMIGDVWEWTASDFTAYPDFVAHPYREYSEVFFDQGYRVLRGGSFASSAAVVTPTFRNWDHPERRQVFAGLRVAVER
jgi:iron(II)-dependent oxidoreductase